MFSSLEEISLVREELDTSFLFVSSFMAFHRDTEFRFELVRYVALFLCFLYSSCCLFFKEMVASE